MIELPLRALFAGMAIGLAIDIAELAPRHRLAPRSLVSLARLPGQSCVDRSGDDRLR